MLIAYLTMQIASLLSTMLPMRISLYNRCRVKQTHKCKESRHKILP